MSRAQWASVTKLAIALHTVLSAACSSHSCYLLQSSMWLLPCFAQCHLLIMASPAEQWCPGRSGLGYKFSDRTAHCANCSMHSKLLLLQQSSTWRLSRIAQHSSPDMPKHRCSWRSGLSAQVHQQPGGQPSAALRLTAPCGRPVPLSQALGRPPRSGTPS